MTTSTNAEKRSQDIKVRRLEIAADLAELKRAYLVDGIERPLAKRATLEAEDARLALEDHRMKGEAIQARIDRRRRQEAALLGQLVGLLKERGMGELVAEAEKRAALAEGGGV
jgi:hypothetical protein